MNILSHTTTQSLFVIQFIVSLSITVLSTLSLLFLTSVSQCCGGELLLSAPALAAPPTLPPSLYPVLPAGGTPGRKVLGAHPSTEQTTRPVAAQFPGRAGVSLPAQRLTHANSKDLS